MPLPTTKGPIKDTKRTRVRFDSIVAPCSRLLPISLVHSMNARKCAHAQKPYPSQAFAQSSKAEKRGRGQDAHGKKGSPAKQKPN